MSIRWLLTYFASQSARLVAPSTCSVQSLASYSLRLAVCWACGAIDVQLAVVGFLLTMLRSQCGSWRHRRAVSIRWMLTYFASQSARLVAQSAGLAAPSTCAVQSLASYFLGRAVSWARRAIDVRRAVVGFLLTLPRGQLGSWRHRHAVSSRWLLTYGASQSAWVVAPSMWIEQSLAAYLLCRAVSLARGAIDVQ